MSKITTLSLIKKVFPEVTSVPKSNTCVFPSVSDARKAVAKCKKQGRILKCEKTAKLLGYETSVYAEYENVFVLFNVNEDVAHIEYIPWDWSIICEMYRPKGTDEWEWWSMGCGLTIMLGALFNSGAKKIVFTPTHIEGWSGKYDFSFLSDKCIHDPKKMTAFPKRPVIPPPPPPPPLPESETKPIKKGKKRGE